MPFKSQAQRGFMYANDPAMAQEFESHTPKGAQLPYKVGPASPTKSGTDMKKQKLAAKMLRQGTLD